MKEDTYMVVMSESNLYNISFFKEESEAIDYAIRSNHGSKFYICKVCELITSLI